MEDVNILVSTLMVLMNADVEVATDCPVMGEIALVKYMAQNYVLCIK